ETAGEGHVARQAGAASERDLEELAGGEAVVVLGGADLDARATAVEARVLALADALDPQVRRGRARGGRGVGQGGGEGGVEGLVGHGVMFPRACGARPPRPPRRVSPTWSAVTPGSAATRRV